MLEYKQPRVPDNPVRLKMYAELELKRTCYTCKVEKNFQQFGNDRTQAEKKSYKCKACKKIERKNRECSNPEKTKKKSKQYDLKRTYGITLDQYNHLFDLQSGCCAICKRHQSILKRGLAVDHCHKTKTVRGLLCDNCNPGLGYFKDSEDWLEAAVHYLKKFKN